jgi:hypothetical protein
VFDLFLIFDFARVDLALVDTVEGRRDLFRERADLVAIVCRCSHHEYGVGLSDSDFEGFKRIILDDRPLCLSCGGGEGEQYKPTRTKNKVVSMIPGFTAKKYRNTCIQTTNQDVVHVVRLA